MNKKRIIYFDWVLDGCVVEPSMNHCAAHPAAA